MGSQTGLSAVLPCVLYACYAAAVGAVDVRMVHQPQVVDRRT